MRRKDHRPGEAVHLLREPGVEGVSRAWDGDGALGWRRQVLGSHPAGGHHFPGESAQDYAADWKHLLRAGYLTPFLNSYVIRASCLSGDCPRIRDSHVIRIVSSSLSHPLLIIFFGFLMSGFVWFQEKLAGGIAWLFAIVGPWTRPLSYFGKNGRKWFQGIVGIMWNFGIIDITKFYIW